MVTRVVCTASCEHLRCPRKPSQALAQLVEATLQDGQQPGAVPVRGSLHRVLASGQRVADSMRLRNGSLSTQALKLMNRTIMQPCSTTALHCVVGLAGK